MASVDEITREIERLHDFFVAWFRGDMTREDGPGLVEKALASEFELVTPDGKTLDRDAVLEWITSAHKSRDESFEIWIENVRVRHVDELVVATYEEWQKSSSTPTRGRLSTAVFKPWNDHITWLHVHETWLESPVEPGEGIFLTLSGGGFRAAAFHLGTLEVLDEVGLLDKVHLISTVSGGTLLGLRWLKSRLDGDTFEEFDASMKSFLRNTHVLRDALAGLGDKKLIQAAAEVYAQESFLGDMKFGELDALLDDGIGEVVVNTTEFVHGTEFRFAASANPRISFGRPGMTVDRNHRKMARAADVAAASSCFPGVFEPIVFPTDFVFETGLGDSASIKSDDLDEVPLMDGGIHDNQGFAAVMRIADRKNPPRPEFAIFSDVALTGLEPMSRKHAEPWTSSHMKVRDLESLARGALPALGILLIAVAGVQFYLGHVSGVALSIVLVILIIAGHVFVSRKFASGGRAVELASSLSTREILGSLSSLSVNRLQVLLRLRLHSVIELFGSVFMNRIRAQGYSSVYSRLYRKLPGIFIIGQQIGDLLDNNIFEERHGPMTTELAEHLARANESPTTLWFDDESELQALVHCGRATMAHNLLDSLSPDDPRHDRIGSIIDDYVSGQRKTIR